MERIASFTIDHLELYPGLYVSRRDKKENVVITTFDMRITAPNREPVIDMPALHTIEHLGVTGSSELYYGGNFEIKNIDGASGSSLNIYSFDMGNNLKLTESINNTEVLIKSGITELKAGLQFLNWGTINNETYGGPIFNYSGIPTVSDGVKGSVFLGPDNVKIPDPDSIPVVSFYLHKTVDYNWNITLKENMEEWQGYTILDDYDATIRRYREINYDELIETYFPVFLTILHMVPILLSHL